MLPHIERLDLFDRCMAGRSSLDAFKQFEALLKLRESISLRLNDIQEEQERAAEYTREQKKEIAALQSTCPHTLTKYYPDAAGGSDSWTECQICGADLRGRR